MNKILTIVGPTAVGKTKIAIRIARRISGEIISADSRQIYKYLDIGTAKPTFRERKVVNFHLIDFINPDSSYSCGQFSRDAQFKINEIKNRNNIPIVCGGTGLYIKALFNPLHKLPQSDKKIKARLTKMLERHGINYLYRRLMAIDPEWAEKIKSKDKQRILRGLEIYEITGKSLSKLIKMKKMKPNYLPCYVGLNLPRDVLYQRINLRFDEMIKSGLVKEVKLLIKKGFSSESNVLRTIGYKEIIEYIDGKLTLAEAIEKAKQRTRNFAKRQITWFSKIPDVQWYNSENSYIVESIIKHFEAKCRH